MVRETHTTDYHSLTLAEQVISNNGSHCTVH